MLGDLQGPNIELASKIELYKIIVDSAERNIDRRMRVNQFYFSIVTALFIAHSYLVGGRMEILKRVNSSSTSITDEIIATTPLWLLPLALMIITLSWYSVLLNFRSLSVAKYRVIGEIEAELPLQPFKSEWGHYKSQRRVETTQLEIALPVIFYLAGLGGVLAPFLQ